MQRRIASNGMQHIHNCAPIVRTRSADNLGADAVSGGACPSTTKRAVGADAATSTVCAALAEARCGQMHQWIIHTCTLPCAHVNKNAKTLPTKPSDSSCNSCSAQFTLRPASQSYPAAVPGNEQATQARKCSMLSNYTEWQCNEPYNRVPTVFRETANVDVTCVITKTTDINPLKNCRARAKLSHQMRSQI